jgi:hypothetical protein
MGIAQRTLVLAGIGLMLFFGWKVVIRSAHEIAVLHTGTVANQDHYATLWVVDDNGYTWIRAESPRRLWLPAVRQDSNVMLRRRGREISYRATVWDSAEAREHVDPLFRTKYGVAEIARGLLRQGETIPIRLEPN